ncbi:hypothetical protein ANN_09441 [Periplaneta americana]|uniref:Helitron helicase-like domain-containing protein n=1 Tax=Periplaneta americana TaxID=6978 RepID=A0ABQ8TLM9_PERAM|nr:hypothetical protein ANN_09441 [Periplaneta americana]
MCCSNGKVRLPLVFPSNEFLPYMCGTTAESKLFLQNIKRYNSGFQITSFGATSIVEETGFMPTFKVQGQIYHTAGSILPLPDENLKFLQIYFMGDEKLEADPRCDNIPGTVRDIVLNMRKILHEHDHLIIIFKTALKRMPTDKYKVVIRADKDQQTSMNVTSMLLKLVK